MLDKILFMKTFSLKARDIKKRWYVIDARDVIVGRLAAFAASLLRGKHKPEYTPHLDCGDNLVIINADKIHYTGNKLKDKVFYWHTGYPGGIKQRSMGQILKSRYPERVLYKAIERMIPRGPLGRKIMGNVKIYAGDMHSHEAQNPEILNFASLNRKNKRSI